MTITLEPPLTLEWVMRHVQDLREEHRRARKALAPGRTWFTHNNILAVSYQRRCDMLRNTFVYMLAWHRVEGDPVAMARELSRLAELLPTEEPTADRVNSSTPSASKEPT